MARLPRNKISVHFGSMVSWREELASSNKCVQIDMEAHIDELRSPSPDDEPDHEAEVLQRYREKLVPLLDIIPDDEADMIQMYYFDRKTQNDIAEVFGMTQAAVSYRIQRAMQRLQFFASVPDIDPTMIREDLASVLKPSEIDIVESMYWTTCQSKTAELLGRTQGYVRETFARVIDKLLESPNRDHEDYATYFRELQARGLNMRHFVKLPQWMDRGYEGERTLSPDGTLSEPRTRKALVRRRALPDEVVRSIREDYAVAPELHSVIAKRHKTTSTMIGSILHGHSYRSAGGPMPDRKPRTKRKPVRCPKK